MTLEHKLQMNRRIVSGNWKMNKLANEAVDLVETISQYAANNEHVKTILAVPAPYLALLTTKQKNNLHIAAQNCHHQPKGAYTGEWSAAMLKSLGINYCLVGHSERRIYFHENDQEIFEKTRQCLSHDVHPIFCLGEQLEDRENDRFFEVIEKQLSLLMTLNQEELENVIIAYEPVWAIGTGKTASSAQAQEIHAFIRQQITKQFNDDVANLIPILYGGSCKPDNAKELFSQTDVDGGLIGGASLQANDFISIIKANEL